MANNSNTASTFEKPGAPRGKEEDQPFERAGCPAFHAARPELRATAAQQVQKAAATTADR
jgi:hypothetical protein